jgi:hypothetical protein
MKEKAPKREKIEDHQDDHSEHACYVLITCDLPKEDGSMNINMTYKGDPLLASYLLRDAQTKMDEDIDIQ